MKPFFYLQPIIVEGEQMLELHGRDGKEIIDIPFSPYCYRAWRKGSKKSEFKDAETHKPVTKKEFETVKALSAYMWTYDPHYEADVDYVSRVLIDMDWKIEDVPKCWLDIETDTSSGFSDPTKDAILSIGMIFDDGREVFLTTVGKRGYDEEDMLREFMDLMQNVGMIITYNGGSDVWESRSFDMPYLAKRWGIVVEDMFPHHNALPFAFDELLQHCAFVDIYQTYKNEMARVGLSPAGGFSLDNVANVELGERKIQRSAMFNELSAKELEEYNMRDVVLLKKIDDKFSFTDMRIGLAQLCHTTLTTWRNNKKRDTLSSLRLIDNLVIEYSKRKGLVWRTNQYGKKSGDLKGGFVLEPIVGLHKSVQNYDVKQMYPSIMINERLSPDKDRVVIPDLLRELKQIRSKLKARYEETKSKEDFVSQYNYKVLANIMYGSFANPASRYFRNDIANVITQKGRNIVTRMKTICEDLGFKVVYQDTDSSFVVIEKSKVNALESVINRKLSPYEVEAGEYYKSILFTGDERGGSKKRYAGLKEDNTMKFVGVQSIRRDYCTLSRESQIWALERLLHGDNVVNVQNDMLNIYRGMKRGEYDDMLLITKGVKRLSEYDTKRGFLPHVRAFVKLNKATGLELHDISFWHTKSDVTPYHESVRMYSETPSDIDYEYYYNNQIRPVIDPLIKSIQIQQGVYSNVKRGKTVNESLLGYISS